MCLVEVMKYDANRETKGERNEKVNTLLTRFSKHGVDVLADLVKYRRQVQGYGPSFRSVPQSVPRSVFGQMGTLQFRGTMLKREALPVIERSCGIRTGLYLLLRSLDEAEDCEIDL